MGRISGDDYHLFEQLEHESGVGTDSFSMSDMPNDLKSSGETIVEPRARVAFVQCRDVELQTEAEAFFAFFVLQGRFWSVHRRFNLDLPNLALLPERYRSEIILSEYDHSEGRLRQISEKILCIGEDPRVVSDGERAFVLCRGGLHEVGDYQATYKLVTLPEGIETRISVPDGIDLGKNWQPYLKDGRLFAVHGFAPLRVLEIALNGRAKSHRRKDTEFNIPAPHDGFTIARGGSNGVVADDLVIGLGHFTTDVHVHWPFLWTLDNSMRIRLALTECFFGVRKKGFNIVDPTSLFHYAGHIYVGLCASEREWFYNQRFLNLLIELPLAEFTDLLSLKNDDAFADLAQDEGTDLPASRTFLPSAMPNQVKTEISGNGVKSKGEAGCLIHGPYERVDVEGEYVATLSYFCSSSPSLSTPAHFDVSCFVDGEVHVLARTKLNGSLGTVQTATLSFSTVGHVGSLLETRVFVAKGAEVDVHSIRVMEARGAGKWQR